MIQLRYLRLHRPVHHTNVPVDDPDTLRGAMGILFASLAHLDPLDEQSQQLRREFIDGSVPLRLLNECIHIGCRCPQILQPHFFFRNRILQCLLFRIVIIGEHPELLGSYPSKDVILVETLEQH